MAPIPQFDLNDGTKIPAVGLGCWMGNVEGAPRAYEMCIKALKAGYRHFDTASGYENEKEVGRAIRESGIPRKDIFITTKIPNPGHHNVKGEFEQSLKELDCEYIDLLLMHWPMANVMGPDGVNFVPRPDESPTYIETWKDMEKLLETGKVKSIGVSNFGAPLIEKLIPHCKVIPSNNQIECHPCLPQKDIRDVCAKYGITVTAYSPLGRGPVLMGNETINEVAKELNVTPAQVCLSWAVQQNVIVVPKSENKDRLAANLNIVTLSAEQMERVSSIHKEPGMHKSLLKYHVDGEVFGWTHEQLGWNMSSDGTVPK
ncbi:aado/keto reductase [Cylindrobasidium torrendii FP15055 ss-10]|uniref:Aado/keto reductase n=1 Tax=Cylindrobasidium torrendii FP15055 ss-10 TaxID=1314674 RepID=A0A0D7B114_9AGAR|nr:aado/keto reductase [Cylindrobasidium torrendii FP15055 ss-10]